MNSILRKGAGVCGAIVIAHLCFNIFVLYSALPSIVDASIVVREELLPGAVKWIVACAPADWCAYFIAPLVFWTVLRLLLRAPPSIGLLSPIMAIGIGNLLLWFVIPIVYAKLTLATVPELNPKQGLISVIYVLAFTGAAVAGEIESRHRPN